MQFTNHEAVQICEALQEWVAHSAPATSAKTIASFDALLGKIMREYSIERCDYCEEYAPNRGNWRTATAGRICPTCRERHSLEDMP